MIAMSLNISKQCLNCGRIEKSMKKCSKCDEILKINSYYCSKKCQKLDWKHHRCVFHTTAADNYKQSDFKNYTADFDDSSLSSAVTLNHRHVAGCNEDRTDQLLRSHEKTGSEPASTFPSKNWILMKIWNLHTFPSTLPTKNWVLMKTLKSAYFPWQASPSRSQTELRSFQIGVLHAICTCPFRAKGAFGVPAVAALAAAAWLLMGMLVSAISCLAQRLSNCFRA